MYLAGDVRDRRFAGFEKITKQDALGITQTYYHQGDTHRRPRGELTDSFALLGKPYREDVLSPASTRCERRSIVERGRASVAHRRAALTPTPSTSNRAAHSTPRSVMSARPVSISRSDITLAGVGEIRELHASGEHDGRSSGSAIDGQPAIVLFLSDDRTLCISDIAVDGLQRCTAASTCRGRRQPALGTTLRSRRAAPPSSSM